MRRIFLLYFSRGRIGVRGDGGEKGRGEEQEQREGGGIDQGRGARKCAESRDVGTGSKEDWVGA
jgi:hypothetical protein